MDIEKDDFRTVIEDARVRHGAVVGLIYQTDNQALALLRLYATLVVATASGAIASLGPSASLPRPLGWALIAATLVLAVGSSLCLMALRSSRINLPGRSADFWRWAASEDITRRHALDAYLATLETKGASNNKINARTATALKWAKLCSLVLPIAMLTAGWLAAVRAF
jgi:4-alpha-glucanotransferase